MGGSESDRGWVVLVLVADWVVEADGLTVRYGRVTAVDGISLSARSGEILGLLGPNGAGKTSVIRALATIVPVSAGSVRVGGHGLSDPMGIRSSIGVLPESNGYPGAQTARAYLRFFAELFGLSPIEARSRAEHKLRQLGLRDNAQDRIGTFSRGMRQRLGLARALINDPAVLLLDEPTLGLDPSGQEELLGHLAHAAAQDSVCVVLCSHQLDEVERVCDRVAIMHEGRIVAEGTVDKVIDASGVAGIARLRIAPDDVATARRVLLASSAVRSVAVDNARPGDLDLDLDAVDGARGEVLSRLLDKGIEPRSFDFEGARLSDAYRALTFADREASQ
jgi:ABC-2 type transport system ATP-binding protein